MEVTIYNIQSLLNENYFLNKIVSDDVRDVIDHTAHDTWVVVNHEKKEYRILAPDVATYKRIQDSLISTNFSDVWIATYTIKVPQS